MKLLFLRVGLACNNRCMMCAGTWIPQKTLTTEALIRKLEAGASRGFDEVVFSGGEPTIRRDICDIAAAARALGYPSIVLQTNARRLDDPEFADRLLEAGITRFLVSLHGATPETHDAITHVPGSFFQAIRGIRNAQRHGQSKVRLAIHTVVLPGNYHELSSIVDLVFALGIPMLKFSYVVPVGEATSVYAEGGMPDLQHTMPFIQRAVDRFLLLYGSTPMTSIAIGYVPVCALSGYERFSDEFNAPPTFFINDSLELELADTLFAEQGLKVKREACARCAHARECGGVWREYVSHFGWDEFKPVAPR